MANIYDVASAIQQPNIVGNVQQGIQTARQNAMGNIALQQAQQQQQDAQTLRGLAPQIVSGDQSAYNQAAALNPDQANALQAVNDAKYRRMNGAINFVESQPTPAAKQAAWAQTRPYFAQLGGVDISQVPEDLNAAQPGFQAVKAHLASLPVNSTTLTPGSVLANKDTGAVLYNNQAGDKFYQAPVGPNGEKALVAVNPHGGGQGSIVSLGGNGVPSGGMSSPDFFNAVNGLTDKYGATITSGVRDAQHNAEVGGVPNSQHLTGTAADVVIPPAQKAQFIADAKAQGLQPIDEGDHVHLQNPNGGAGVSGVRLAVGTPAPKVNSWQQRIQAAKSLGASDQQVQGMVLGASGMNNAQSSDLSPGALENATVNYMLTGQLPPIGRGGQGQAQRTAIMNHAADMAQASGVSPAELATRAGQQKALQGSLNAYQKRADAMAGQENSFLNNLDQAQKISDLVDRTRSPAINRFLQTGEFESGDQDVAALRAALIPVAADYAKIMSGATGAGGTPVSTMEEALSLIRSDLSKGQFNTVAQVLRNDVHNQRLGSLQQLHAIRDNMSRFGNGSQGGTTAKQTPQEEMAPTPNLPGQNASATGQDFSHLWGG